MKWKYYGKRLVRSLIRLARAKPTNGLDLLGDRDIEWSWVAGNLPENKGDVLDFGPSNATSSLIAALGGGRVIGLDHEAQPPAAYVHSNLALVQGDILTYDFGDRRFDTII